MYNLKYVKSVTNQLYCSSKVPQTQLENKDGQNWPTMTLILDLLTQNL